MLKESILDNLSSQAGNYAIDMEAILDLVFNESNLAKQPRYLVGFCGRNSSLLAHVYQYIKLKTKRGAHLGVYPLKVVAVVKDDNCAAQFQKELADLPVEIMISKEGKASEILQEFKRLKIEDPQLSLYLEFFLDDPISFIEYAELRTLFGVIALRSNTDEEPEYFLEGAKRGWFCKNLHKYPKLSPFTRIILSYFEQRAYRVRPATLKDLPAIYKLENSCTNEIYRLPRELIEKCIEGYPDGQFLLESENKLVGFILSQRIAKLDELKNIEENTVHQLHEPNGSTIQLISLTALPEAAKLEHSFLEFFLQKTLLTSKVNQIASVIHCHNFPGPDVIGMESYVEELIHEKGSPDAAVKFHMLHGAEIRQPIKQYFPKDEKNLGYGLLITYTRGSRLEAFTPLSANQSSPLKQEINSDSIRTAVDQAVRFLLPNQNDYERSKTFLDMGLKASQLQGLRTFLYTEYSFELEESALILYPTPEALIQFLIKTKLQCFHELLYEIKWQGFDGPSPHKSVPGKLWIVFADNDHSFAGSLKRVLQENDQTCVLVVRGNTFVKQEDHFTIDPYSQESYQALLATVNDIQGLEGIIYLGNEIENRYEFNDPTIETLEAAHRNSLEGLIFLLNALSGLEREKSIRLGIVTKSIEHDGNTHSLTESVLSAFCKSAREEYQQFDFKVVAIDPQAPKDESCERLFSEVQSESDELQIAFRNGERLVPRLVRVEVDSVSIPKFSHKGIYLIAGGFRPLGILLARWYVLHGVRHLVLLDEIDISPEIAAAIDEFRKEGVQVSLEKHKLDEEIAIKAVFDKIHHNPFPLKGMIHALSITGNHLVRHSNWDSFNQAHRLKVTLGWFLHKYSQTFDLDHFILFSSCLGNIAPYGKANHATWDSFFDALSHYRWKRALPSLTISWGPWEHRYSQLLTSIANETYDRTKVMEIKKAIQMLDHLFYQNRPQMIVADINWPVLLRDLGDTNPLLNEMAIEIGFKRRDIIKHYIQSPSENRTVIIETFLFETIKRILKLGMNGQIEADCNLQEIGLDSSQRLILRNHLVHEFEEWIRLPKDFVEKNTTIKKIRDALILKLEEYLNSFQENHG